MFNYLIIHEQEEGNGHLVILLELNCVCLVWNVYIEKLCAVFDVSEAITWFRLVQGHSDFFYRDFQIELKHRKKKTRCTRNTRLELWLARKQKTRKQKRRK